MTQPTLDFTAAPTSLNERLAAYFKARPGQFIDGRELSKVGGCYAYRTRLSDIRRAPFSMNIVNRLRRVDGPNGRYTVSEYAYEPQPDPSQGDPVQCVPVQHGEAARP